MMHDNQITQIISGQGSVNAFHLVSTLMDMVEWGWQAVQWINELCLALNGTHSIIILAIVCQIYLEGVLANTRCQNITVKDYTLHFKPDKQFFLMLMKYRTFPRVHKISSMTVSE